MDWRVILVAVIIAQLGAGIMMLGVPEYAQQDTKVIEQYQSDQQIDIFMIYYTDKDEINVEQEIQGFNEQYPGYEILEYEKTIKVTEDRAYEVLVIYAQKVGDAE